MAAAEVAALATTMLGDLPGNKMPAFELPRSTPRKIEPDPAPRNGLRLSADSLQPGIESRRRLQPIVSKAVVRRESASQGSLDLASAVQRSAEITTATESRSLRSSIDSDRETLATPRHTFNASRERLLLDNLIQFDEDEGDRLLRLQSDDEIYRRWREGESVHRKASDGRSNRALNGKPPLAGAAASKNNHTKREPFCGWETKSKRTKPSKQGSRNDRRYRSALTTATKYFGNSSDKLTNGDANFKFFHYTDIGLYMQQYRQTYTVPPAPGQVQTNGTAQAGLYAQYFDKSCLRFDTRDFPVKFDLSSAHDTAPVRHRVAANHLMVKKEEAAAPPPTVAPQKRPPPTIAEISPLPNCASPAALHPRFATPKPPSPSMKLETTYRNVNTTTKVNWSSRTPESTASNSTHSHSSSGGFHPTQHKHQTHTKEARSKDISNASFDYLGCDRQKAVSRSLTDATAEANHNLVPRRVVHSAGGRSSIRTDDEELENSAPYQTSHKSFSASRLRQIPFEDNALRERCDALATRQPHYVTLQDDDDMAEKAAKGHSVTSELKREPELNEGKLRLQAIIAAEIQNLQQRKAITIEQRRKLDNFRRALSNSTYHSDTPSPVPVCPRLSGSVRAFYTRTANAVATANSKRAAASESRHKPNRCGSRVENPEDSQPIIYVSQPQLRQISSKKSEKSEPGGRRIIGGALSKKDANGKDFRQFTRITDLLSAKRRQVRTAAGAYNSTLNPLSRKRNVNRY